MIRVLALCFVLGLGTLACDDGDSKDLDRPFTPPNEMGKPKMGPTQHIPNPDGAPCEEICLALGDKYRALFTTEDSVDCRCAEIQRN